MFTIIMETKIIDIKREGFNEKETSTIELFNKTFNCGYMAKRFKNIAKAERKHGMIFDFRIPIVNSDEVIFRFVIVNRRCNLIQKPISTSHTQSNEWESVELDKYVQEPIPEILEKKLAQVCRNYRQYTHSELVIQPSDVFEEKYLNFIIEAYCTLTEYEFPVVIETFANLRNIIKSALIA